MTDEVVFPGKMSIFWEEFLMTMPWIPESEMRTLEPLPMMMGNILFADEFLRCSLPSGCPLDRSEVTRSLRAEKLSAALTSAIYFRIDLNWKLFLVWIKMSAGPPIFRVV